MARAWTAAAILVLGIIGWTQDDDRIEDLIRQLGDDDYATREAASRELAKYGARAAPALKKVLEDPATDLETRTRAKAVLDEIDKASRLAEAYTPRKPITFKAENEKFADVLARLGKETGVAFQGTRPDKAVTVNVVNGTLLQILDELCRQVKNVRYRWSAQTTVEFTPGEFKEYPTCYVEAFKVKIARIERYSSLSGGDRRSIVTFTFETEAEGGVKPVGIPRVRITRVLDADGNELRTSEISFKSSDSKDDNPGGGANIMVVNGRVIEPNAPGVTRAFFETPVDAKLLQRIKAEVTVHFALAREEIRLPWSDGDEIEVGGYRVRMGVGAEIMRPLQGLRRGEERIQLTIRPRDPESQELSRQLADLVDTDSVLIVDKNGKEHAAKAEIASERIGGVRVKMVNGQPVVDDGREGGVRVLINPGDFKPKDIQEIRLKVSGLERRVFQLEFTGVPLP